MEEVQKSKLGITNEIEVNQCNHVVKFRRYESSAC